jgi:hypothetical protein
VLRAQCVFVNQLENDMVPIIVGVGVIGIAAIAKARPSTLFRVLEDSVVGAGKAVARGARSATHGVRIEYNARQLARVAKRVEKHEAELSGMSNAQRAAHDRDVEAIVSRAKEIRGL